MEAMPEFLAVLAELSDDYRSALAKLRVLAREEDLGAYAEDGLFPYSVNTDYNLRTRVVDLALAVAQKRGRREIFDTDVVEAIFEAHNEIWPIINNAVWTDEKLHTAYNTLSHLTGAYEPSLDVPLDAILDKLNVTELPSSPVQRAPAVARGAMLSLFQDHPDYERNCFVIMSFAGTRLHTTIFEAIHETLAKHGYTAIRADMRSYSDDLLTNVYAYMHGSAFAVAVFERLESDVLNPNVSFEVGYLYGLGKQVCLLKERTLRQLHSDVVGRLYVEFDAQAVRRTVSNGLTRWLADKRLI
jgi:hypothetical protein